MSQTNPTDESCLHMCLLPFIKAKQETLAASCFSSYFTAGMLAACLPRLSPKLLILCCELSEAERYQLLLVVSFGPLKVKRL